MGAALAVLAVWGVSSATSLWLCVRSRGEICGLIMLTGPIGLGLSIRDYEEFMRHTRGGKRPGAGRPRGTVRGGSEVMATRVPESIAAQFDARAQARGETRTEALRRLIQREATMTTIDTITDERIATLRDEAGAHGDQEQVEICTRALAGDKAAIRECVRVIADSEAMAD
jgi:hypothetical protein